MRQRVRFNGMNQRAWLSSGGNEVVPSPRRQVPALPADGGDVGGDRVQPAEVVQQPRIDAVLLQRGLNGGDVERRRGNSPGSGRHGSSIDCHSAAPSAYCKPTTTL